MVLRKPPRWREALARGRRERDGRPSVFISRLIPHKAPSVHGRDGRRHWTQTPKRRSESMKGNEPDVATELLSIPKEWPQAEALFRA